MKNIKNYINFINEGNNDDETLSPNVKELMNKFGLNSEEAIELDKLVDEILDMDDLDERMDYVEGLVLWHITQDSDKEEEILQYLKDICIG